MPTPTSPREMLQAIKTKIVTETDKTFAQWVKLAKETGITKHKALTDWLKKENGLRHNQALWIAWEVIDPGRASQYENPERLVDTLYSGKKALLRPIYDELIKVATAIDTDIKVVVCKTYSSLRSKAQFAIIIPRTQTTIDIELALPLTTKATKTLEAYVGHNEKFNFRIRVSDIQQINDTVIKAIEQANEFMKQ